jgi:hypothetical protein
VSQPKRLISRANTVNVTRKFGQETEILEAFF